jgi:hypothetical protein
MNRISKTLSLVLPVLFAATRMASADSCDTVFDSNIRNITSDESSFTSLHTIYDSYCSASGEIKSEHAGFNFEAVIKAIPLKFGGESGSASQRMSSFCKNYSEIRFSDEWRNLALNTVSVEALKEYNVCRAIQAQYGVTISHSYAAPGGILVHFDFANPTTAFRLEFVTAGPKTDCGATAFSTDGNWQKLEKKAYEIKSNFEILCEREGTKGDDGSITYDATWVGIGTNLGAYSIPIQMDQLYSNELASEATASIAALEGELQAAKTEMAAITAANETKARQISGLRIEKHRALIGHPNPGGGFRMYGCGTDPNNIKAALCTNAYLSDVTAGMKSGGGGCGYGSYVVTCVYLGQ